MLIWFQHTDEAAVVADSQKHSTAIWVVNEKLEVVFNFGVCPFSAAATVEKIEQRMSLGELNHECVDRWSTAEAVLPEFSSLRTRIEEHAYNDCGMQRDVIASHHVFEDFRSDTFCGASTPETAVSSQVTSKLRECQPGSDGQERERGSHASDFVTLYASPSISTTTNGWTGRVANEDRNMALGSL